MSHMCTKFHWRRNDADQGEGYHRLLTSVFPCNAHRVNVKIAHIRGHGAPVPPPPRSTAFAKLLLTHRICVCLLLIGRYLLVHTSLLSQLLSYALADEGIEKRKYVKTRKYLIISSQDKTFIASKGKNSDFLPYEKYTYWVSVLEGGTLPLSRSECPEYLGGRLPEP